MAKRVEYLAGLLKGLTAYSNTLSADDGKGFADGFSALHEAGVGNACKAAQDPENVPKNRYRNVPGMCPRGLYALDVHIYDSLPTQCVIPAHCIDALVGPWLYAPFDGWL